MDYIDQLKQLSARVEQLLPNIATEEATKTALILPFFQLLGYDVFNPLEFVPEYVADVGVKKGEKVDYAIVIDGNPAILIEAKWCGENLNAHSSQLFRYFGTTTAKIGILTNGVVYRFYTDLDEPNKMDLSPFMEFDMLDIKENLIPELKRFHRNSLDLDKVFNAASDLKYTTAIKTFFSAQAANPTDDFVRYLVGQVYTGVRTAAIIEKFKPIVKRSFSQYLNDVMNDRFKTMLTDAGEDTPKVEQTQAAETADLPVDDNNGITTTETELEAYVIIKTLLHDVIDPSRIMYKDTKSYFVILLDNKATKWICRLCVEGKKKAIIFNTGDSAGEKHPLQSTNDIFAMKDKLTAAVNIHITA